MYKIHNGKVYKIYYFPPEYANKEMWLYWDEAPPKTVFSLALNIMAKYERINQTDCCAYRYAQRVAIKKLIGG